MGLSRARKCGTRLGRPRTFVREISLTVGISRGAAQRTCSVISNRFLPDKTPETPRKYPENSS